MVAALVEESCRSFRIQEQLERKQATANELDKEKKAEAKSESKTKKQTGSSRYNDFVNLVQIWSAEGFRDLRKKKR